MPRRRERALGPPALKVAGLQLWVHGREFPDAQDYDDADWLLVTVHCGAYGASVWAFGAIVMVSDLTQWGRECERLHERLRGRAALSPVEPNLSATVKPLKDKGRYLLRVDVTPDHVKQQHTFKFEIDQAGLASITEQVCAIEAEYPIRGSRDRS